jgi:uncharacterized membrane protein
MKFRTVVVTGLFIVLASLLWLSLMMKGIFSKELSNLVDMRHGTFGPRLLPIVCQYFFIIASFFLFVFKPHYKDGCSSLAGWGFLFGFFIYGAYNFTSMTFWRVWPWHVSILSILWGSVVMMLAGIISCYVNRSN